MNPLVPLDSLDRYADRMDEFIRLAHEYRHEQRDVVLYVAETRNLTVEHAEGVVARRWPSQATAFDQICLADNEWGSPLMRQVAEEWFKTHPLCNFVSIYEHAGWALAFYRHKSGEARCCASANTDAKFPANTPRATHFSGVCHRRPVLRPDLKEVEDLLDYKPEILTPFVREMAHELGVDSAELAALA
jgi:hypothetical protein